MSSSSIGERLRRGAPGARIILLPKQEVIEGIGFAKAGEGTRIDAQEVKDVADRFNRAVQPALDSLHRIGLRDARDGHNVPAPAAAALRSWNEQRSGSDMYERLSLVRAIAVRLQDDRKIDDVLTATQSMFDVVLDVRTESDPVLQRTRMLRRRPNARWPRASGIEEAWQRDIRGIGVVVGVLDTGVDADHSEFRGKQIEFRYFSPSALDGSSPRNVRGFDTDGHGTHVCGIIAGKRTGVARDVNLHVASVIESETMRASLWRTVYGLDWMFRLFMQEQFINVPCVVNLSLCFFEDLMTPEEVGDWRLVLGRAVEDLHRKDALVIAAAGNRGAGFIGFPASFDNVLAVGAVDSRGQVAHFSGAPTSSARRDIYGYGVDVYSAFERSKDGRSIYMPLDGTSMAAPYVTGIASMLRQTKPGASASAVRQHMLETALDGGPGIRIARFVHWPHSVQLAP